MRLFYRPNPYDAEPTDSVVTSYDPTLARNFRSVCYKNHRLAPPQEAAVARYSYRNLTYMPLG